MPNVIKTKEQTIQDTGCCKRFIPEPWNERKISWNDKRFLKDHVTSFMHMPLNYGRVMGRMQKKINEAGASLQDDALTLTDEKSSWGADVYVAVSDDIAGAEIVRISGTFLTKVFEGQFRDVGKWIQKMEQYVKDQDKSTDKLYFWYTTCPKCAKAYGENYVVLLAKVN